MEKTEPQSRAESRTRHVEQIHACLRSGDYTRALDLLRGAAADFPNATELSELEKRAHDGIQRNADAQCLITQSQELFAQQKSTEAIQLLRQAYELDKCNSLARSILANALVEHAHSIVESDWLEAETLTNQALALNSAHPTAKSILSRIVEQKKTSSVEDWVEQARKRQSSGDLFAALAWVAEGLAVHPDDSKLLQVQDEVQRDQAARRRQDRRRDLDDLRRMGNEINRAADAAAKQGLAERIQAVAAKYWTDGEILSIANAFLLRLGLVSRSSATASPQRKGAALILHVPRPNAPPAPSDARPVPPNPIQANQGASSPVAPSQAAATVVAPTADSPNPDPPDHVSSNPAEPNPVPPAKVSTGIFPPSSVAPNPIPTGKPSASVAPPKKVPPRVTPQVKGRTTLPDPRPAPPKASTASPAKPSMPAAKVTLPSSKPRQPARSGLTTVILVSAAAIVLVAATFFFTRRHYSRPGGKAAAASPVVSLPTVSAPALTAPTVSVPSPPSVSAPAETNPEPSVSASPLSSGTAEKVTLENQPPVEAGRNFGTLLIVAGQDGARVLLNGRLQPQLTRGGELRLQNLELQDYVVQVSKSGFLDPPQQKIRLRKGEQALVFNLQPQPSSSASRLASLAIQGGSPGTAVLIDQTPVGSIQSDGTLSVASINPGEHTVELRKDRFKPRQFKKHFDAGATISLAAADATLEAAPGELKITFAPADANVALVKGSLLKMVSSGVPLNLEAGTYTLTARTVERFTRSATLEVVAGQSKSLDLSLAPNGMPKWEDPGAWKREGDWFTRKGGDFVLYGVAPASGTFTFSAMLVKGHLLQWVLNYTDPKNYVLLQMDDKNFYRSVIRNGEKTDEIIVPHIGDRKSFHTLQIRVSSTEIVHQIKQGESWRVLDRLTQPGANPSLGKFGFYIPGNDQVAVSGFAHYADLNIR